jgi:hypothetical protein
MVFPDLCTVGGSVGRPRPGHALGPVGHPAHVPSTPPCRRPWINASGEATGPTVAADPALVLSGAGSAPVAPVPRRVTGRFWAGARDDAPRPPSRLRTSPARAVGLCGSTPQRRRATAANPRSGLRWRTHGGDSPDRRGDGVSGGVDRPLPRLRSPRGSERRAAPGSGGVPLPSAATGDGGSAGMERQTAAVAPGRRVGRLDRPHASEQPRIGQEIAAPDPGDGRSRRVAAAVRSRRPPRSPGSPATAPIHPEPRQGRRSGAPTPSGPFRCGAGRCRNAAERLPARRS